MKNKQKRTKNSYLYIIFLALAFIILLGTGAYAYYQTTISGTITGTVARWSFTANNQTSTFNIDFGSLYPGKTGTYNLELSAGNSDLPIVFEVIYHYPDQTTTTGQLKTHAFFKPLCFPSYEETFEESFICSNNNFSMFEKYNALLVGYKGYILAGERATIPIYYNWPYEGEDDKSMADGRSVSLGITIIGRQIDISNETSYLMSMATSDLLGLRSNSSCTANDYGYTCDIDYLDLFYLEAIANGFVQVDLETLQKGWHPDIASLINSFWYIYSDESGNITLSDGSVLEMQKFGVSPIFANYYS